jgi:hypothetical protein
MNPNWFTGIGGPPLAGWNATPLVGWNGKVGAVGIGLIEGDAF